MRLLECLHVFAQSVDTTEVVGGNAQCGQRPVDVVGLLEEYTATCCILPNEGDPDAVRAQGVGRTVMTQYRMSITTLPFRVCS